MVRFLFGKTRTRRMAVWGLRLFLENWAIRDSFRPTESGKFYPNSYEMSQVAIILPLSWYLTRRWVSPPPFFTDELIEPFLLIYLFAFSSTEVRIQIAWVGSWMTSHFKELWRDLNQNQRFMSPHLDGRRRKRLSLSAAANYDFDDKIVKKRAASPRCALTPR